MYGHKSRGKHLGRKEGSQGVRWQGGAFSKLPLQQLRQKAKGESVVAFSSAVTEAPAMAKLITRARLDRGWITNARLKLELEYERVVANFYSKVPKWE